MSKFQTIETLPDASKNKLTGKTRRKRGRKINLLIKKELKR